jgi:hypothetical protein
LSSGSAVDRFGAAFLCDVEQHPSFLGGTGQRRATQEDDGNSLKKSCGEPMKPIMFNQPISTLDLVLETPLVGVP